MEKEYSKEKIKEILLNGDDEIGFVQSERNVKNNNKESKKNFPEVISKAMPKKMYELGKLGIGFPSDVTTRIYWSGAHESDREKVYKNDFITIEECNDIQRNAVEKRKRKVERFKQKAINSKEYDKKGVISLPLYSTDEVEYEGFDTPIDPVTTILEYIEIEVTQRELAEAGILPEDFNWKEKALVTKKDIADLDKEQSLTTMEVGGIKGFIKRLIDKFKGKGEK